MSNQTPAQSTGEFIEAGQLQKTLGFLFLSRSTTQSKDIIPASNQVSVPRITAIRLLVNEATFSR